MRADADRADRNALVRSAARAWKKAGAIDEATLAKIEAAVPDDRVRVGPVFRILLFVFTVLAANAGLGFAWLLIGSPSGSQEELMIALLLLFGLALVALTEYQVGPLRRAQGGTEAGTAFAALSFLIGGITWLVSDKLSLPDRTGVALVFTVAALLLALAAWRWGYALAAAGAAAALLGALSFLPGARLLWIVLPLAAAPVLARLADSARLPPALRDGATAALVVGLAGLYLAVHLGSFDHGVIELGLRLFNAPRPAARGDVLRGLSIAATALVPLAYLAAGIWTRRALLLLGLATGAASLITLATYVHLGPPWAVLTVAGIALIGVVFALRRVLDSGPARERGGFTAEPLFEDLSRQRLLEVAATAVTFTPEARPLHEEPKFEGGGGQFGGGGASEGF